MPALDSTSCVFVGAARTRNDIFGGLFRRSPGAQSWERLSKGLPDVEVSVQAITIDPTDPRTLYIGTRSGAFKSTNRGDSWRRLDLPSAAREIWSVQLHPGNPRVVYAGASPVGIYRSDDGGERWRKLSTPDLPQRVKGAFANRVMRIAIDPVNPSNMFATLEINGTLRSRDAGETWEDCSAGLIKLAEQPTLKSRIEDENDAEGMLDGHAVCFSPAAADRVYLAVRMGLFRSDDHGVSWKNLDVGRFAPYRYGRDVRVAPCEPKTLYVCLSPASVSVEGAIFRSQDLGETWERFDRGARPRSTMMGVAVHHSDPNQVFGVTRRGQVFGTRDGGISWEQNPLPEACQDVFCIACG
ncbi:MAG: WD40/YVTN/BNR-like repeat-containing protein [Burkholderiales bacterium]